PKRGTHLLTLPTGPVGFAAFSGDARYLGTAGPDGLRLWELATGREVLRRRRPEPIRGRHGDAFVSSLAFAPDGRALATGLLDTTVLLWGLEPDGRPADNPTAADLRRWRADLAGEDAAKGYAAAWRLARARAHKVVPFLKEHLRPAVSADARR